MHDETSHSSSTTLCYRGVTAELALQGFDRNELNTERFLNLRYDGTDVPVMTHCTEGNEYAQVGCCSCGSCDHVCV